jgi:hypothetical protein
MTLREQVRAALEDEPFDVGRAADAVLAVVRERVEALDTYDAGTTMEPGVLLDEVMALLDGRA